MARSNKRNNNQQAQQPAQAETFPPNTVELSPTTLGVVLTAGKKYAIKNPTRYSDDPQNILTEDIFRSSIPEGFFVVLAVGPRHYVPIEYDPAVDIEPGEQTGFAPNFTQDNGLDPNPMRQRMLRQFYGQDEKGGDQLLSDRSKLLARTNAVSAASASPSGIGGDKAIVHEPQGQTVGGTVPEPKVTPASLSAAGGNPPQETNPDDIPETL